MKTTSRTVTAVILIATAMVLSLLVTTPADANTGYYHSSASGPCPHWSIQNVLDDPDSDWDGDRVSNVDEVYVAGGLNPCVYDSTNFCGAQPQYCYNYLSTDYCGSYYYSNHDCYDTYYGHNSYRYDTHHYYDVYYYDPYYDYYYVYVPKVTVTLCSGGHWSWNQVNAYPHQDWDGDGVNNYTEAINGYNPCVANAYYYTHTYTAPTTSLPHVGGPGAATGVNSYNPCPAGYPYYHPQNGQCYANPVRPWG